MRRRIWPKKQRRTTIHKKKFVVSKSFSWFDYFTRTFSLEHIVQVSERLRLHFLRRSRAVCFLSFLVYVRAAQLKHYLTITRKPSNTHSATHRWLLFLFFFSLACSLACLLRLRLPTHRISTRQVRNEKQRKQQQNERRKKSLTHTHTHTSACTYAGVGKPYKKDPLSVFQAFQS